MIISSNRYTVQPAYAAENAERIREVMAELRAMQRTDITYRVFLQDDGKTFIGGCALMKRRARFLTTWLHSNDFRKRF